MVFGVFHTASDAVCAVAQPSMMLHKSTNRHAVRLTSNSAALNVEHTPALQNAFLSPDSLSWSRHLRHLAVRKII